MDHHFGDLDPHHFGNLDPHPDPDPHPHPHQIKNPDPDPHQFADDTPKCVENEPILALFQGFESLLQARICFRNRICIRVKSQIRIRIKKKKYNNDETSKTQHYIETSYW
jgi:hypothetical protein